MTPICDDLRLVAMAAVNHRGRLVRVLERSRELGFLGPGPIEAHLHHAAGFATGVPKPPERFLDLGSGGGVPGLVLAELWPTSLVTLLDSNRRRCAFLTEAASQLGFGDRVGVERARAEEAGHGHELRGAFDLVVCRGFGPPAVTAECGAPFLRVGGLLVVSDPPAVTDPGGDVVGTETAPRWDPEGLAVIGLAPAATWTSPEHFTAMIQEWPCPPRFARRIGIPAKRPLF